jgi:hypothetical protein
MRSELRVTSILTVCFFVIIVLVGEELGLTRLQAGETIVLSPTWFVESIQWIDLLAEAD